MATAAPDTPSVLPEDAQLPLLPHPSFSLIAVDCRLTQSGRRCPDRIFDGLKVEKTSSFLAIHRTTGGIVIRSLDRAAAAFTRALFEPDGLQSEPLPQHLTLLAEHLALGCFKDVSYAELISRLIELAEAVPYALLALPLRVAVATVFWSSGQTKIADWDATLQLFRDDYQVPLVPPGIAAHLALAVELSMPVLLILGSGQRFAALVLLGMTSVIEIFVYPQAWPTHIQWPRCSSFC